MLRTIMLLGAFTAASSSSAQPHAYTALQDAREADRLAAEQAARQRDTAIANDLSRLQAQLQTNQALSDLAAARSAPAAPRIIYNPNGPAPKLDTNKLAQIPDATLADSNAKVRAASQNRR